MGQYRQWLHYREMDQHLQAQLTMLEQELAQLQEHTHLLENTITYTENPIIQALSACQHIPQTPVSHNTAAAAVASSINPILTSHTTLPTETISPALFAWSSLPNFDARKVPAAPTLKATTLTPLPSTPQPETDLLPTDMAAFIDTHAHTSPQIKLPWWLKGGLPSSQTTDPLDQQSIRTNQSVARWLTRWGRQAKDTKNTKNTTL